MALRLACMSSCRRSALNIPFSLKSSLIPHQVWSNKGINSTRNFREDSISHRPLPKAVGSVKIIPQAYRSVINERSSFLNSCSFHTSNRRNVHPAILLLLKPLAKVTSIITGRTARVWWRKLNQEEKQKYSEKLRPLLGLLTFSALCFGMVNYFTHLQKTPITGRTRYIAFTPEQFRKIIQFEYEMQYEQWKDKIVPPSNPVYKQVASVAQRIVNGNQDQEFFQKQKWTVYVVDAPQQNAFVLPTGHIFVFTGLLRIVQNNDQLAVVIGHEMSHALLNHGAEQVSRANFIDWFVILFLAGLWFVMPTDGLALVTQWFYNKVVQIMLHLPYNRMLEAEADEVGLQLMAKACFDVRESSNFWNLMTILTDGSTDGGIEIPEFISTHPSNDTRAVTLDKLIPEALKEREFCKCPPLIAKDPRVQLEFLRKIAESNLKEINAQKSQGITVSPKS